MLVAFDFDGALVRSDPYVLLAEPHGVDGAVTSRLDAVARGEEPLADALPAVAGELAGLPVEQAGVALDRLQVRAGAADLLRDCHAADHHVAVVTDAPRRAVEHVLDPVDFAVDAVIANRLPEANDALTGDLEGPVLAEGKDGALSGAAAAAGVDPAETIAVADDRRDIPMLQAAGTGVGVDPAPVVSDIADLTVPSVERLHLRLQERNVV
ncbi:MAG: HAD family hydrolase [Halobacteriaceae archaeon]